MFNLTDYDHTFVADNGDERRVLRSGYIAVVETEKRAVGTEPISFWGKPYNPTVAMSVKSTIEIVEETPVGIAMHYSASGMSLHNIVWPEFGLHVQLLVTREVAEAAKILNHPLTDRMVWASKIRILSPYDAEPCKECGMAEGKSVFGQLNRVK